MFVFLQYKLTLKKAHGLGWVKIYQRWKTEYLWPPCVLYLNTLEEVREPTYTAAICKFWGVDIFFVFGLAPSVAQLSSASYYFLSFSAAAYVYLET